MGEGEGGRERERDFGRGSRKYIGSFGEKLSLNEAPTGLVGRRQT